MPTKINSYACNFRCGFVRTNRKRVATHEKRCSMNPERRGCGTCKHFNKFMESNGMHHDPAYLHEWMDAECLLHEDLLQEPTEKNPLGMVFDCDRWEGR